MGTDDCRPSPRFPTDDASLQVGSDSWWPAQKIILFFPLTNVFEKLRLLNLVPCFWTCFWTCLAQASRNPSPSTCHQCFFVHRSILVGYEVSFLLSTGSRPRVQRYPGTGHDSAFWNKPVPPQGSPLKKEHTSGWIECGLFITRPVTHLR